MKSSKGGGKNQFFRLRLGLEKGAIPSHSLTLSLSVKRNLKFIAEFIFTTLQFQCHIIKTVRA